MNSQCPHCLSGKTYLKRERLITSHNNIELFYNSYINYCKLCNSEFHTTKSLKMTSNSYKAALNRARKETTYVY